MNVSDRAVDEYVVVHQQPPRLDRLPQNLLMQPLFPLVISAPDERLVGGDRNTARQLVPPSCRLEAGQVGRQLAHVGLRESAGPAVVDEEHLDTVEMVELLNLVQSKNVEKH